jgi:hypothetical protein
MELFEHRQDTQKVLDFEAFQIWAFGVSDAHLGNKFVQIYSKIQKAPKSETLLVPSISEKRYSAYTIQRISSGQF